MIMLPPRKEDKDAEKVRLLKAKSLFLHLPSLRDVYICLKWDESEDGMLDVEYERWGRSAVGPVLVAWKSRVHPTLAHFCPCC